ncbi:uncharacterized protein LOC126977920 [Leptidea sinapis]|uniref:Uncharacterized protein n=1 Tax=Leptidea sinapis TaxID=189913 RepID=A0A5E4PZN2_9NEOP|nr:uncharacterized protein LOC126977920 [Leptidea sinapis]VVC90749.1 unnamed protein product [Leptidea sinapis]
MLAIRNLLKSSALAKNVVQQRNMSVIAVPARNKVSTGELLFLSAIMFVGWTSIPVYVLVNMKHYRSKE